VIVTDRSTTFDNSSAQMHEVAKVVAWLGGAPSVTTTRCRAVADQADSEGSELQQRFGARLRQLRRAAGLTQEQLAESAGLPADTISMTERGLIGPSFGSLARLARSLCVRGAAVSVVLRRLAGAGDGVGWLDALVPSLLLVQPHP
jgi:DNA-binding XRE family transcriptional regulator